MKIVDSKLWLKIDELVACGLNYRTITDAKDKGSKCWSFIKDPDDGRKVLVSYDALKPVYKMMVDQRFQNIYEMVARQPILDAVVNDARAYEYYMGYKVPVLTGPVKGLPAERIPQYSRAASWLNMLQCQLGNQVEKRRFNMWISRELHLDIPTFYVHVKALMELEKDNGKNNRYVGTGVLPGDFPTSYKRLLDKIHAYKAGGYDSLIDANYGNKHAAKIGKGPTVAVERAIIVPKRVELSTGFDTQNEGKDVVFAPIIPSKEGGFALDLYEQQMAVIRSCSAMHQNFDAAQICKMVNSVFVKKGWKTLSRATIVRILSENKHLLTPGRRGARVYDSTISRQVKRSAPEFPLFYWTMDGWTVELMYQEGKDYKRLVAVIVLDAMNKYPVGYAIGERENVELIRQANRNALRHVEDVLGGAFRPWQVQSDNYQIKNLTPFYQAMAHISTPAAVGNAKSKVVEPYFMYLNKQYCQMHQNWTGFNVDARKENQVNKEFLNKIKNQVPDKAGVIAQIDRIIAAERAKKVEEFVAKWDDMPAADKLTMSDMDWLMIFGQPVNDRTNRVTGQGIVKMIDGVQRVYDSFDPNFRALSHINWNIVADPADSSKVLAMSEDGRLKFLLEETRVLPMSIKETKPEDVAYRMQITQFNKERKAEITTLYAQDHAVASEIISNSFLGMNDDEELALKGMFTIKGQQKERLQDAKRLGIAAQKEEEQQAAITNDLWQQQQMDYIRSQTDLSMFM